MNFSVPATGDGPEAEEGLEIPGFPKPHKPKGFAGNLQVRTYALLLALDVRILYSTVWTMRENEDS